MTRKIPSTGEEIPAVGLGTWQVFDAGNDAAARAPLREVLVQFAKAGGKLIDSSPMYGSAESVAGDLVAVSNPAREVLFTVLARDEKYKAKNVIDIVAVRGADAAGGWAFAALRSLGMEIRAISLVAIGIAAACFALALALGRAQERRTGGRDG